MTVSELEFVVVRSLTVELNASVDHTVAPLGLVRQTRE
jgi:hypothetical protein